MTHEELMQSMKEECRNNELDIITIDNIESLKGKRIQTLSFGYRGQDNVDDFVVGEVISRYELASREVMDDGRTRAQYWESYMGAERIQQEKDNLTILADDGRQVYIYFDKKRNFEGEFHQGDLDRYVYYRIVK